MNREEALLYMVREGPFGVSVQRADEYLEPWGTNVMRLGVPVMDPTKANPRTVLVARLGYFVMIAQVASRLALSLGLFDNKDHAEQTPHRSAQKTMQYITERSVLRLALAEPESKRKGVVQFLRERHQFDRLAAGELRYFKGD